MTIHLPGDDYGRPPAEESAEPVTEPVAGADEPAAEGAEATTPDGLPKKKRTRRGSRGGRKRKKPAAASGNGAGPETEAEADAEVDDELEVEPRAAEAAEPEAVEEPEPIAEEPEPIRQPELEPEPSANGDSSEEWGYVPMSEWLDDIDSNR